MTHVVKPTEASILLYPMLEHRAPVLRSLAFSSSHPVVLAASYTCCLQQLACTGLHYRASPPQNSFLLSIPARTDSLGASAPPSSVYKSSVF